LKSAWELDGYAVQIGLRQLGGRPHAFYQLSTEEQIDVLAVLQVERDAADRPRERGRGARPGGGVNTGDRVNWASDSAREFWGSAFRS
jgi:hypothetical protein